MMFSVTPTVDILDIATTHACAKDFVLLVAPLPGTSDDYP